MEENWAPVVGYEKSYEVSNLGHVKSLDRFFWNKALNAWVPIKGRIIRPGCNRQGQPYVVLSKQGKGKTYKVHTLVLTAFVGPRPDGHDARHFPDRDPLNNKLANLSWSTHAKNMADMITHGTNTPGEKNRHAKLTDKQVIEIRSLNKAGLSCGKIAEIFPVNRSIISRICARTIWKHVA